MPAPVYIWKDFEFPITPGFAVTDCIITSYSNGSVSNGCAPGTMFAYGTVNSIDYCEHAFAGTDEWQARQITATEWRVESAQENCWGKDPDGRLRFTASERIDSALQAFVNEMILEYEKHRVPNMQIVICPPAYKGVIVPYAGPCICERLRNNPTDTSLWQTITNGQFPKNCIACSCGQCWWLPDTMPEGKPPAWMHISDHLLFDRLLRHNGARTAEIVMDQRTKSLELLTTYLRRTGDIMLLGPLVAGKTRQRGEVTISSVFDMVVEG